MPTAVAGGLAFRRISAGGGHTCGLTMEGKAYCWGSDNLGQVGDGKTAIARTRPTAVLGGLNFGQIATGVAHSCAVTTNKKAYCCGLHFSSIGGGLTELHACAVGTDAKAYCWGQNTWGQLGDGTENSARWTPAPVVWP